MAIPAIPSLSTLKTLPVTWSRAARSDLLPYVPTACFRVGEETARGARRELGYLPRLCRSPREDAASLLTSLGTLPCSSPALQTPGGKRPRQAPP